MELPISSTSSTIEESSVHGPGVSRERSPGLESEKKPHG